MTLRLDGAVKGICGHGQTGKLARGVMVKFYRTGDKRHRRLGQALLGYPNPTMAVESASRPGDNHPAEDTAASVALALPRLSVSEVSGVVIAEVLWRFAWVG
jgi:hypothetical protein